mgnify:CR=1 FL=1
MNIAPYEAKIIASAIDYFVKQDLPYIPEKRKIEFDNQALEAKAIIVACEKEMNISHIQAVSLAIETYISFLKKSVLTNPQVLNTAEALADRFGILLEPFLD